MMNEIEVLQEENARLEKEVMRLSAYVDSLEEENAGLKVELNEVRALAQQEPDALLRALAEERALGERWHRALVWLERYRSTSMVPPDDVDATIREVRLERWLAAGW